MRHRGEQLRIFTSKEWSPSLSKWKITLEGGNPIGPRLKKGGEWPSYPIELDNEADAMYYQKKWEDWINYENRGIKRYFRKN